MDTFEETIETVIEGGFQTPDDKLSKEVSETSALDCETQKNAVRVCDVTNGGDVSVVNTRFVETEISVETSFEVVNVDGVVDGKVKNGSYSSLESQENGKEIGVKHGDVVERVNGSASVLGVDKNDEKGVENDGACDSSSLLIGGEKFDELTSVLGVNHNGKNGDKNMAGGNSLLLIGGEKIEGPENGVKKMAAGEDSSMLFGDNIEGPKLEIEVKEGNNLDNGASMDDNDRNLNSATFKVSAEKDGDGHDVGDDKSAYSVGDFVWGKIKHHPWWPGQIYDLLDASEYALKFKQRDCHLVAYSGDGMFAWCNSSQLKPFEENFVEFSKQSNSKSFINAVEAALEEIVELVQWKMTCSCVLKDNQIGLTRPIARNAGVKDGVFRSEGGNGKLTQFEPAQILADLKYISQVASIGGMLELTTIKSKLSAFYRAKGGYQLPVYHLPQHIIGLEDNIQTGVIKNGDCNGKLDVSDNGTIKEDWLSSPGPLGFDNMSQSPLQKAPSISEDKLYQRRKQKSIAEIICAEMDVDPKYKGKDMAKEKTELTKPASTSRWRKKKGNDEAEHHGGTTLSTSSGKRKKPKLVGVPKTMKKDASSVENGGGSRDKTKKGPVSRKNKNSSDKIDGFTAKKESEMGYSPRERKKSKYLSPPFTNPERPERNNSSKRESEVGYLSVTSSLRIGERMGKAPGQLFASPPLLKCSAETHKKELPTELGVEHDISGSSIPPTPKPAQKMVVDSIVTKAPANKVLSKLRNAALGHLHLREPKSLDMIKVFFSTFRSSIFRNGPYYKLYNKRHPGRKRKLVDTESGLLAKDLNLTDPNSPEIKSRKTGIKKNEAKSDTPKHKQGHGVDRSESKKNEKGPEGNGSSAALLLTFGPGVSLPSKDDLIETYSKFGPLDKEGTDVLFNSTCAQVVFVNSSDAEQAFKHTMSSNNDANITYRLRYLNPGLKIHEPHDSPHPKASSLPKDGGDASESSSLESIKQKLEMMTSLVDKSDGNMSQEMKMNLEGELKGLLEKVSTL